MFVANNSIIYELSKQLQEIHLFSDKIDRANFLDFLI